MQGVNQSKRTNYISSVLPELGVDHIQQTTFTSWAMEILKEENISLPSSTYDVSVNTEGSTRYKGSEQYTRLLRSALERYEKKPFPQKVSFLGKEQKFLNRSSEFGFKKSISITLSPKEKNE